MGSLIPRDHLVRPAAVVVLVVLVGDVPQAWRDEGVGLRRAPAPPLVEADRRRVVEDRLQDLPRALHAVLVDEQRVIALHRLQQEQLVGVGDLVLAEIGRVVEIHRHAAEAHPRARALRVERERDALVGLDPDREVVALGQLHLGPLEDVERDLAELQRDLAHLLLQSLAGPQEERDAGPPPVVDVELHRREGLRRGVGRDARLAAVALVLAAHHRRGPARLRGAQHLDGLVPQPVRLERHGRLHRDEGHRLEQVGRDHVADVPHLLVELASALDADLLGNRDLYVIDVATVPERLEHPVGETDGQDVLHRLLAEVVVDPEHLRLVEHLVHDGVQLTGALGGPGRTASRR